MVGIVVCVHVVPSVENADVTPVLVEVNIGKPISSVSVVSLKESTVICPNILCSNVMIIQLRKCVL